jgi:hypothetical protein
MWSPSIGRHPAWTIPLRPFDGELLSSWLCRSARAHGAGAHVFLSCRFPGVTFWDRDLDRSAPPALLDRIDVVSGCPRGTAEAASLRPWVIALGGLRRGEGIGGHVAFVLACGIHHRERRLHGLQYCPECLAQRPAGHRRVGRLAFVVACPSHGTALRDACPSCDAPLVPHRVRRCDMTSCHRCGGGLMVPVGGPFDEHDLRSAMDLQTRCLAALGRPDLADELALVRDLARAASAGTTRARLDDVLGRPGRSRAVSGRRQLERMRLAERVPYLATLAEWVAHPDPIGVARQAGMTRRSFRDVASTRLADLLPGLDDGLRRPRAAWRSVLDDASMRRLRRTDASAYRNARARRILATPDLAPAG